MRKYLLLTAIFLINHASLFAQPPNDEPCGATLLNIIPDVEECTPDITMQWSAATTTAIANPFCGSGQLFDVWYRFTSPANGKVNIRVSTSVPGSNDGAIAVYEGSNCNTPGALIDCNDDAIGINPGLTLTGLVPGTNYLLRVWNFSSANGNFSICLSSPEIPPPAIDPTKRVGIGTSTPQANLDLNGTLIVRGGLPTSGKVLTATDNKGTTAWKSPYEGRPAFKICLSNNQAVATYNVEYPLSLKSSQYDITQLFNMTDSSFYLNDNPGSIYHFDFNLIYAMTVNFNSGVQKRGYVRVYQNNVLVHEFISSPFIDFNQGYSHNGSFDIQTLTNNDIIKINVLFYFAGGSIGSGSVYTPAVNIKNSCVSGFKIN